MNSISLTITTKEEKGVLDEITFFQVMESTFHMFIYT